MTQQLPSSTPASPGAVATTANIAPHPDTPSGWSRLAPSRWASPQAAAALPLMMSALQVSAPPPTPRRTCGAPSLMTPGLCRTALPKAAARLRTPG